MRNHAANLHAIATADKTKPLRARGYRGATGTCAICECELQPDEWVVTLPAGLGVAQTHCAADRGFAIE